MSINFKASLIDESSRTNIFLNSSNRDDFLSSFRPNEMQISQFKLDVENFCKPEEFDTSLYLEKIFNQIENGFPDEYLAIFLKLNIFDYLIDILCKSPDIRCRIYSILILFNASYYCEKSFFGPPYLTDKNLFKEFMTEPLDEKSDPDIKKPFIPLYYSKLISINLKYSEELLQAFYESGIYQDFIELCLSIDNEKSEYICCWFDLILALSSSNIPDKFQLYQIYQKYCEFKYYPNYLQSIQLFIDSSSDELFQLINENTQTFTQLIFILNYYYEKEIQTYEDSQNRIICMRTLYNMINKDQNNFCDLSQLPTNTLSGIIKFNNQDDQVSAIHLLSISLKKDKQFLKYSLIDNFAENEIYLTLVEHCDQFSFKTKYAMYEFFILSLIRATTDQLDMFLVDFDIFKPVFENIDCTNKDLMILLTELLERILSNDEFIRKYLLPYRRFFYQISNESADENGDIIFRVCDVLSQYPTI